jgi:hypothetical protein
VTPPEARTPIRPKAPQIGDVEITKPSEKIQNGRDEVFFVAGDLAHVPNSPNMHFSTSNISGKEKNSRRFEAVTQAVEKMRIYPPPSDLADNQKEAGSRPAARRLCRAKTPSFRISRVELTGSFSAVNRDLFSLNRELF